MKRLVFPLLIALFFFSCARNKGVSLPNDILFELNKGERLFSNSEKVLKDQYFSFFKDAPIPLFKNIVSKKYTIHTGIPYNTSSLDLCEKDLLKHTFKNIKSSSGNCYKAFKDDKGTILVSYLVKNKGQMYILATTKDTILLNTTLSKQALDQRITTY